MYYVKSSDGRTHFCIDKGMLIIKDQWGEKKYNANDVATLSGLLLACSEEIQQYAENERTGKKVSIRERFEEAIGMDDEEDQGFVEGVDVGEH